MLLKPSQFIECAKDIFRFDNQTELIIFVVVLYNNEKITWDKNEMENVYWVTFNNLLNKSNQYSEMTTYWVKNVNWANLSKT